MHVMHCTSQNSSSTYINSMCERVTWGHLIPQVIPDLLYSVLPGMFLDSKSSGCLSAGYQKTCFQMHLCIKSKGCFKSCLYSL